MLEQMMLWITRSTPYNLLTGHRLRGIGHATLAVPVLQVRRAQDFRPFACPDVLAFTSAHGVDHHPFKSRWRDLPVFTVGDHTAEAARRVGYRNVRSARGDVSDLQKLIVTNVPRPASVVHFSAAETAGDLVGYLQRSGYESSRQVVHEALPIDDIGLQHAVNALPMIDGIVIHSPKAARRVAEIIASAGWYGVVFCISRDCASEFRNLPGLLLEVAPRPTEESLMNVLRLYRGRRSPEPDEEPRRRVIAPFRIPRGRASDRPASFANDNVGETPKAHWSSRTRITEDLDDPPPSAA